MWPAIGIGVLVFVVLVLILSVFTVQQQTVAIVQRFGKHVRIAQPGLQFKVPVADMVAGRLNLRVQQLDVKVETEKGHVTLDGTAPDLAARDRAGSMALAAKGVQSVNNRIKVNG